MLHLVDALALSARTVSVVIRHSSQVPSCACRKRSRAAQPSARKSSVLRRGRFLEPWSLLFEPSLGHGPEGIRGSCLYAVSSRASFHAWIAAVSEECAGIATSSSSLFERDLGTSPQAHAVSSAGESALKPPPFGTGGRSGALAWPGESPCQSAPAWSAWRLPWGYGPRMRGLVSPASAGCNGIWWTPGNKKPRD